jgi:hypothetical protein
VRSGIILDRDEKSMMGAGRTPATRGALSRQDLLPITILLLVGSAAFFRLFALPPFEDEGTELRWIWRVIEAGEWLQPLADGKPLQVWPVVPFVWLGLPPLGVMRALNVIDPTQSFTFPDDTERTNHAATFA